MDIALLVVGIIGFVKGRINVTSTKELRGGSMYFVATLCCLPLPLGLLIAFSGVDKDPDDAKAILLLMTLAILVLCIVLLFALAKPKLNQPGVQGFPMQMPAGYPQQPGQYPPPAGYPGSYPPGQPGAYVAPPQTPPNSAWPPRT